MAVSTARVLAFTLLPVAAVVVGGAGAAVRVPGPRTRSGVQHLAAGVVFAAAALELLPAVVREHATLAAVIGFAAGIGLMLAVRELTEPSPREGAERKGAAGLLTAIAIDILIDGVLVGVGFAAGSEAGVLLTIALTLEVLFVGVATVTTLMQGGTSVRQALVATAALAALLALGALVGTLVVSRFSGSALEVVLTFGTAALLFLVTEELLVEAHEVEETPLTTAMFFGGFLLFLVIDLVGGPAAG